VTLDSFQQKQDFQQRRCTVILGPLQAGHIITRCTMLLLITLMVASSMYSRSAEIRVTH
jgi:hypothetical protein